LKGPSDLTEEQLPRVRLEPYLRQPLGDYYWNSLSHSGVRSTWSGLANSRYVGELRIHLRNVLCGVSLLRGGLGGVGVDERVEGT
jgi:hypothetical protein